MSNLTTAVAALHKSQGTSTDVKVTLIDEIVSFYRAYSDATPQHLMSESVNKSFTGRAWGAWYVHKGLMDAKDVAVAFVANNYDIIELKADKVAFAGELARVSAIASKKRSDDKAAAKSSGKAYAGLVDKAKSALSALRDEVPVPSPEADAFIMALKADYALVIAAYERQLTTQQEKTPINA